jgi:hypothetical protein
MIQIAGSEDKEIEVKMILPSSGSSSAESGCCPAPSAEPDCLASPPHGHGRDHAIPHRSSRPPAAQGTGWKRPEKRGSGGMGRR